MCDGEADDVDSICELYAAEAHRIGPMSPVSDPAGCDRTRPDATPGGRIEPKPDLALEGIVEPALARALVLAAEAGRWDVVEQIARELKERRRDREDTARPQLFVFTGARLILAVQNHLD